ncbi:MAG: hypothetical protein ACLPQ6_13470 [Steroidobacteraceae bacterium]
MPDQSNKKPTPEAAAHHRRRIGLIVHDDRGMASVEWRDAPADEQRPVLEILGHPQLALKNDDESFDPYSRNTASLPKPNPGNTTRTDLRKLSEWIKKKRELEARKLRSGGDDADES